MSLLWGDDVVEMPIANFALLDELPTRYTAWPPGGTNVGRMQWDMDASGVKFWTTRVSNSEPSGPLRRFQGDQSNKPRVNTGHAFTLHFELGKLDPQAALCGLASGVDPGSRITRRSCLSICQFPINFPQVLVFPRCAGSVDDGRCLENLLL
jgi:hypothetical protein